MYSSLFGGQFYNRDKQEKKRCRDRSESMEKEEKKNKMEEKRNIKDNKKIDRIYERKKER